MKRKVQKCEEKQANSGVSYDYLSNWLAFAVQSRYKPRNGGYFEIIREKAHQSPIFESKFRLVSRKLQFFRL